MTRTIRQRFKRRALWMSCVFYDGFVLTISPYLQYAKVPAPAVAAWIWLLAAAIWLSLVLLVIWRRNGTRGDPAAPIGDEVLW